MSLTQAKEYFQQGHFAQGSMGPKIAAAIKFLQTKNRRRQVIITNPNNLVKALTDKKIGTRITYE
jgi:carbamate kinase